MITVYYDSRCGLCAREINHYRAIAPSGVFDWKDAVDHAEELAADGISLSDALLAMHARNAAGRLHAGVDAFIMIWAQLDRWRLLSWFAGLPVIHQIASVCYKIFARWKFDRLPHCRAAREADTAQ